ncbi:hypothetical protein JRO89_XSUnG0205600 [Xanthoceras sorbifolium]|uniref:Uncharacterized protein n=1 Tax=Xanthoceras sorbifolium TaxID=99658 RepID=A0ABQ8GZ54_9ROSI|nr:hypothetical protein JRO89_XSUnG0205600 [Xanthoceras sorbifolium]
MAGLLAWAADVVGGHKEDEEHPDSSISIVFTAEQQKYVQELDRKAASLSRSVQDLRLRLPPPDIAQRLPHLHAHSLASNAALALQLNSHSATRQQDSKKCIDHAPLWHPWRGINCLHMGGAQLRELTLLEENAAYEKAISNCECKIQEKLQEANSLRRKLKELDEIEKSLAAELDSARTVLNANRSGRVIESEVEPRTADEAGADTDVSESAIREKLEEKKRELSSVEEIVQEWEKQWEQVKHNALKQPSPVQREKMLDKQLHSLIEQLEGKQAQAEGLVSEMHLKEKELERLNGLWRKVESSNIEADTARNRLGRSTYEKGYASADYVVDAHAKLPYYTGRNENQQKLMLLRSAFVLYILALHIAVFIKISF